MTTNKQIIEVAKEMAKILNKLTSQLAQDGTAIEGFVDALEIQNKWAQINCKRALELAYNKHMNRKKLRVK